MTVQKTHGSRITILSAHVCYCFVMMPSSKVPKITSREKLVCTRDARLAVKRLN